MKSNSESLTVRASALALASACLLSGCETTTGPATRAEEDASAVAPTPLTTPAAATPAPGVVADPATAPLAAPAPDFSDRQMVDYTVVQGDSLWRISRDKDVSIADIQAANGMTTDVIQTGQTIVLPLKSSAPTAAPAVAPTTPAPATLPVSPATVTPARDPSVEAVTPAPPAFPGAPTPPPPPPAPTEQ